MPDWNDPPRRPRSPAGGIGKPSRRARGKRDFGSGCAVALGALSLAYLDAVARVVTALNRVLS